MSESNERYKQLALLTVILAEVVVTPTVLAGAAYWILKERPSRNLWVFVSALIGLGVGFYRVYLIQKKVRTDDTRKQ